MVNVPNTLSLLRLLLVPVLLALAWNGQGEIFLNLLVVSLLTDALDGWLARKLNQTSDLGARLDSWADLLTSLSLPLAGWWLRPDVMRAEGAFLLTGVGIYLATILYGWLKFRKLTSYHTWAAKSAAVIVAVAVIAFFAGGPGWPLRVAMPVVIAACLEEICITIIMKSWRANIPTLWHAMQLQRRTNP